MVDNIVTKPLGLVLIVAAHMVLSGPNSVEVKGILGTNITLQLSFNVSVTKNSHFAVYVGQPSDRIKVAEYSQGKSFPGGIFYAHAKNTSVFCHIPNLKLNNRGSYWASLFMGSRPAMESNRVHLIVRPENRSSTVAPMQSDIPIPEDSGSSSSFHIVTVLVVSPVVLLAAAFPWFIWCLVRAKDKQQQQPHQSSNPTIQETIEASTSVPVPSLVYSVLDFPKRPSTVLEMNPTDTEYAAVSYLPEKRRV